MVATMLQELLRRTHLSGAIDIAPAAAEEARAIGVTSLVIYLVDYEQRLLVPVPAPDAAGRHPLSVHGTIAGRAFAASTIVDAEGADDAEQRLWLPLLDGTERLGVMEVAFARTDDLPGELVAAIERYAHLIAILIVTKNAYSDYFEILRRRRPMTAASEMLWGLVPPLVLAGDGFVLSAMLEPCYDMGGDAFDYALNEDALHLAVFDGMGHGLTAAGVTAFALSVYRHSRRHGFDLAKTYETIDAALTEQYPDSRFVTALLARLDLGEGRLNWISAGHPAPLLLRDGRLVKTLDLVPGTPLGAGVATGAPAVGGESLEPGDMILLYTDGLTEARRPDGALLTEERLGEFIEREAGSGRAAPEMLRRLREAIIERGEGALRDDATAMLVEWRRGSERRIVPETV